MTWYPTNTDDVTLIVSEVSRNEDGSRAGSTEIANTSAITVDDFTIGTEEDMTALSGVGNATPLGISQGDVEHSFDFTVQGEDATLFNDLAENNSGRAKELEIIARAEDYKAKLVGAYAGTREFSGSSGDPVEFAVEGIATGRDDGTV